MERHRNFTQNTLQLFKIPLLGTNKHGKPISDDIQANHIVSFAKSLSAYRIYNEPLHDKLFDLAESRVPTDAYEREKYLNFLLYSAARHPSNRNYKRMLTIFLKHDGFNRITIKQNVFQILRSFAFQRDYSDLSMWKRLTRNVM
jgi:hypothetical protein